MPIRRPALAALADWLDRGRPVLLGSRAVDRTGRPTVFPRTVGTPSPGRQAAWEAIRRWAAAAGLRGEISPHVLRRHSCATHLLDRSRHPHRPGAAGHASVSTTQIYTRVASGWVQAYLDAHPRARVAGSASGRTADQVTVNAPELQPTHRSRRFFASLSGRGTSEEDATRGPRVVERPRACRVPEIPADQRATRVAVAHLGRPRPARG